MMIKYIYQKLILERFLGSFGVLALCLALGHTLLQLGDDEGTNAEDFKGIGEQGIG